MKNGRLTFILRKIKLTVLWGLPLTGVLSLHTACTEEIDSSNFAIKNEQTAADFLDTHPEFSLITELFHEVTLGQSEGASSLYSVLSARGNYTVFLPTNAAVEAYMAQVGAGSLAELNAEQRELIAKSCIIDNGNTTAYETPDLPVKGSLALPNLNDRLLTCTMDEQSRYTINGTSMIVDEDNEVSNGFIQVVDAVIAPSSLTLDRQIGAAGNLKVFHYLLTETAWADSLHDNLDMSYEDPNRLLNKKLGEFVYDYAQHRYVGYTAMVEPDSIYEQQLGLKVELDENGQLKNGPAFVEKLREKAQPVYGTQAPDDLKHPDNAINRFVAYHLLEGKMPYNRLVFHYNEYGYKYGSYLAPQTTNMPTNVWEYYTTLGKHRCLVQVTQVGDAGFERDIEHKMYVNRISTYANGPEDDYHETGVVPGYAGHLISATNGEYDNNALNGYYFPINELMMYTPGLRNELGRQRIRMDFATILPELVSNNFRGCTRTCFDKDKQFFSNVVRHTTNTEIVYGHVLSSSPWGDSWGDIIRVFGLYDLTLRLPPVPKDGTYELRIGNCHMDIRGMAQLYFGDDPDRLMPAGLPYDMRQTPGPNTPDLPWKEDTDDWTENYENDKALRNQGYMKGPHYFTECNGQGNSTLRNRGGAYATFRRIVTTADLRADKTYYLRIKSALKKYDAELVLDYFEFAPSYIYNGATREDIW